MVNYINNPMYDDFMSLCENATQSIRLCAPFVKSDIVSDILRCAANSVELELITNINLQSFHRKASDIRAINDLIYAGSNVYNCTTLHAKLYIFDDVKCIITSANLTSSGLKRNLERGVFFFEDNSANAIVQDYNIIKHNSEVGKISKKKY